MIAPAFDAAMVAARDRAVPRYTSYPAVPYWSRGGAAAGYAAALDRLAARPGDPVAVYVHVPFCAQRCWYCGCNALVTRRVERVEGYLDRVAAEMTAIAARVGRRRVQQLHWGGGTPNFLTRAQAGRLLAAVTAAFELAPDAELSVEVDPRIAAEDDLHAFAALGFSRVSLGVQDTDPAVQAAIGRRQSEARTRAAFHAARAAGFRSINLDLVYGLPRQDAATFGRTLAAVLDLGPDRVALFSYAHLPAQRPNQRAIDATALPSAEDKVRLLVQAVAAFSAAGYEWLGMDHFARPEDTLAQAARDGRLQRTFMGYVAQAAPHVLAFGPSAISDVDGTFAQNLTGLEAWGDAVAAGALPTDRGMTLDADDRLRRAVIEDLMCNLAVDLDGTRGRFGRSVDEAIPGIVAALAAQVDAGLLVQEGRRYAVTPMGRLLVRAIATAFDRYYGAGAETPAFSRAV